MKLCTLYLSAVVTAVATKVQMVVNYDFSAGPIANDPADTRLDVMKAIFEGANASEHQVEIGVASFVDKPLPSNGVGPFGGYTTTPSQVAYRFDYCYKFHNDFVTSAEEIWRAEFSSPTTYTGLDIRESQFEAVIRSLNDQRFSWSADARKVIVVVTDSYGHTKDYDNVEESSGYFNEPVRCNDARDQTNGGFGAQSISGGRYIKEWAADETEYQAYADLLMKRSCQGELSASDLAQYKSYEEQWPIRRVPHWEEFDITKIKEDPDYDCGATEYPSYADIISAMNEQDATLLVVFVGDNNEDVLWNWALESDAGPNNSLYEVSSAALYRTGHKAVTSDDLSAITTFITTSLEKAF